jgi:hypothetical protein
MKRNILFVIALTMIALNSNAQFKILSNGSVENGLYIRGNGNTFRFLSNNPGTEIGTSTDKIDFWYTGKGFNKLRAESYTKISDSNVKENIVPLLNGLDMVLQFNPYSYYLKEDSGELSTKREYGFIAQEIEILLPELVDTSKDFLLLDYDQIIPFLVGGIKEQQEEIVSSGQQIEVLNNYTEELNRRIEELNQQIIMLNERISICCPKKNITDSITEKNTKELKSKGQGDPNDDIILYQNNPNPFNKNTIIKCKIPKENKDVKICVYNTQGIQVKCFNVTERGIVNIQIQANELSAGIYVYVLIVNGLAIDSKQMVITK